MVVGQKHHPQPDGLDWQPLVVAFLQHAVSLLGGVCEVIISN